MNIPAKVKMECLIALNTLKSQGLKMEGDDYAVLALNVFENCENHIKMLLVQDRIGRFQATEGFAILASKIEMDPLTSCFK